MGGKNNVMNHPLYAKWSGIPYLSPDLLDPMRLKGLADMYDTRAEKFGMMADDRGMKESTTRALMARGALKELYGADY